MYEEVGVALLVRFIESILIALPGRGEGEGEGGHEVPVSVSSSDSVSDA